MNDEQVRVWVGAFGKHPGWDDHIADQGLETELLSQVKRLLYLEGIGGNIDSGAWEGLDDDEKLPGFDHVLLWRWPGGIVVGRLWSSSDGKGRTRYPMIVCAHCRGLAGSWVSGHCLDAIEALATRCREAGDAAGVITAIDNARRQLRADSASAPQALKGPLDGTPAIVELASDAALGKQGLERVSYQIEREFSSFLLTDEESGTRSRTIDVRPRHMRVPACRSGPGDACELWLRFLLERSDPSVPLVAVFRRGEKFCDLIAGEPTRTQFSCFQSSLERLPLTTDIPYTIDPSFAEKVAARVEAGRKGELRDMDIGRIAEQPTRIRRPPIKPDRSQLKTVGVVAGGIVLLLILVFAAIKIAGSAGGSQDPGDGGSGNSEPTRPIDNRPPVQDAEVEARRAAFVEWCGAYAGWFGPLTTIRGVDRVLLEDDAHLSARVLGPIEAAQNRGVSLHPLDAVSNPPPTVTGLAESPPSEVSNDTVWSKTSAARAVIDEVADGLESWPPRREALVAAELLDRAEIPGPAAQLRAAAEASGPGGAGPIVPAVRQLTGLAVDDVEQFVEGVIELDEASEKMIRSPDRVLNEEGAALDGFIAGVRASADLASLAAFAGELQELAPLGAMVGRFVDDGYDGVDTVVFERLSQAHKGSLKGADRLRLWLSEAKKPEMQLLDPGLDPRRTTDVAALLRGVDDSIGGIGETARVELAAEFGEITEARDAVGGSVESLLARRWSTQTRADVERETRAVSREIAVLQGRVRDLRARASQNVAEKIAELRAWNTLSTAGLSSVDEIWRSGRDALLARYESDGNDLALFRDSRAFSDAMEAIDEAAQPESSAPAAGPTWNSAPLVARQTAAREAAVRAHAGAFAGGIVDEDGVRRAVEAIHGDVARADASSAALVATLGAIETHLRNLYAIDEEWADGRTIGGAVSGLGGEEADARAIAPAVFEEVETLGQIGAVGADRAALVSVLGREELSDAGIVAAWQAIGAAAPAGPGGAVELRQEAEWMSRVRTALRGLGDAERAQRLTAWVDQTARARWASALGRSPDWDDLRACVELRESFGGRVEDLSPEARFNLAVLSLRESMNAEADDGANRSLVAAALTESGFAEAPGRLAGDWLARVREIVAEDGDAVPPLDPAAVGPGQAGWRVVEGSNEERLVYEFGGADAVRLAFRLVTLPTGESSYLCETELPVGVVARVAGSDPGFAEGLVASLDWFDPDRDTRRGMLAWAWSGTQAEPEFEAADAWISQELIRDGYMVEAGGAAYPSDATPMQRLSLSSALFVSARLGCRLPTEAEWKRAFEQAASVGVDGGWNLRDQSLARQAAQAQTPGLVVGQPMGPDADAQESLRGEPAYGFDDGSVWLVEVSGGPDTAFKHLIGNVHEIVITDAKDQSEALGLRTVSPEEESPRRWYSVARRIEAGVIGGSLFSRADLSIDAASEVADVRGGWSDVGVRLAFSPGSGRVRRSVASRVLSLVDDAPLLQGE